MDSYRLFFEEYNSEQTEGKHNSETFAGRRALASGLKACFDIAFSEAMLTSTASGKPVLKDFPNIHFNISHSKNLAVAAIAPFPIGVDLEFPRESYSPALIRRVCSPAESNAVFSSENPALEFALLWTKKESYLKLTGQGITVDLRELCIPDRAIFEMKRLRSGHLLTVSYFNR